jgi:hypothetical protein
MKHTQDKRSFVWFKGIQNFNFRDHNSERNESTKEEISTFFYNNLHVANLIIVDKDYIDEQKKAKSKCH